MPARPDLVVKAKLLERQYEENKRSHVAFIDESYLAPAQGATQTPFYLATAYVAPCSDHADIRADLREIVGRDFWHTTEAHRDLALRPIVTQLCEYVGDGGDDERIVIALKKPILPADSDGEAARAACLTELLAVLHEGTFSPAVTLAVFEERKYRTQQNADVRTIAQARALGRIGRHLRTFQASPSYETLLWLPDVVSFAVYQRQISSPHNYLDSFASKVQYLPVVDPEPAPEQAG